MTPTPTKALALESNIKVYTPKSLKDEEFSALLNEIDPDLIVVVAYGKILPAAVLEYPKYGCINLHVSLLPKYRGIAAPTTRYPPSARTAAARENCPMNRIITREVSTAMAIGEIVWA